MRAFEFIINEASIFSRPTYTYGHKIRVATSKNGKALEQKIKEVLPTFDRAEDLEWIESAQGTVVDIAVGKGDFSAIFKRPNGEYLRLIGPMKSIENSITHAPGQKGSVEGNVGDISEPILSAAVVAKLTKREGKAIGMVDESDVLRVLKETINDPNNLYVVEDLNSPIADKIRFTMAVRQPVADFLKRKDIWDMPKYADKLAASVDYVNKPEGDIAKYASHFYKNGKVDEIVIKSDGLSEQRSRKSDIEGFVKDPETGEMRPLKSLDLSLKAGSKNFGSVGGGRLVNPTGKQGVHTKAVELFSPLGVTIPVSGDPKHRSSKVKYWQYAYNIASKKLSEELQGQDAKNEAGVIEQMVSFINTHLTAGDPEVRVVKLERGKATVHTTRGLVDRLKAEDIDLDCIYRDGQSEKTGEDRPEIRIFDKNSNQGFMYIRYGATTDGSKVWNTISMEKLMSEMTMVKKKKGE